MKNKLFLIAISSIGLLAACNGDHTSKAGKSDTIQNRYATPDRDSAKGEKASTMGVDTGKATGTGAVDNSASGGTKIAKDTTKKK